MFTVRYVDTPVRRPRWRFNAATRVTPRLSLGIEYNAVEGEWSPTGNWIAHTESEKWPLVSFGTSSDRIGTPEGNQAYFVTFAKSVPGLKAAPYLSVNYSEFAKGFNFPFGVNLALTEKLDLLAMNDGRKSHLLLTLRQPDYNISLLYIWLKRPGISVSWGF